MEWYYWLLIWWLVGAVSLIAAYISDTGGESFTVGDLLFVFFLGFGGCFLLFVLLGVFLCGAFKDRGWDKELDKFLKGFLAIEIYTPKRGKK